MADRTDAVLLERRGRHLADPLAALHVGAGAAVAILCCAAHSDDAIVASLAAEQVGASVVDLAMDPRVVFACAERIHETVGVRAIIIADAPGCLWWKSIELRYRPLARAG